jgi:conjugal transfer pilus assembly protein TrbC
MPEQSLKLWSEQAARVNGQLFIRGFLDNSLEKTTAKTMALFGKEKNGELLIDPNAFEQYHIKSVPAVVISQPDNCFDEHCPAPQFDIAYGDTALAEALELIVVKGSTAGKQTAKTLLQRVRAHD